MKNFIISGILAISIIGFIGLGIHTVRTNTQTIQLKEIEIKSKEAELIELNLKYESVLNKKANTEKEKQEQREQIEKLKKDRERLERELQAKLDRKAKEAEKLARASENALQAVNPTQGVYASGDCSEWAKLAGIEYTGSVAELIQRESGCNPNAVNPSSGACGIPQALPCSKLGTSDPVEQLKWMHNYVMGRYGSWEAALQWHDSNNWY